MAETIEQQVRVVKSGTEDATIILDASTGNITCGNHGVDGDVLLEDGSGNRRIWLDPGFNRIVIRNASDQQIAQLGRHGNLELGGGGADGDIIMNRGNDTRTVHFDANQANLWMGGSGVDGDIVLFPSNVDHSNDASKGTIHLDANAGDIALRNADCAEDFDIAEGEEIEPGMVMVIDEDGRLRAGSKAYDRRVAGVISGAGGYKPGIVLDRQGRDDRRLPLALMGKVYCRTDASYAPVRVGDLLTTSSTSGHAMRATNPQEAFGAIIGKALEPISSGQSMIPILIALQ